MLKKSRFDGTLLRDLPAFTRLMPYLMPDKKGSTIFYEQKLDVGGTLSYIKAANREYMKRGEILTLFDVVICAALRAVALRPKINRFISGGRYYQRNEIVFNFVAKKRISDEGAEINVKIPFEPQDTLRTVAERVLRYVRRGVSGDGLENEKVVDALLLLPPPLLRLGVRAMSWLDQHNLMLRSLVESDPMWCSIFLTNVGSFGLDSPFHHLFERGNCPIFISVGRVAEEGAEGARRKTLTLRYSYDDRVADGVYIGKALQLVQRFVEDPSLLEERPELSPELLAELRLKPFRG